MISRANRLPLSSSAFVDMFFCETLSKKRLPPLNSCASVRSYFTHLFQICSAKDGMMDSLVSKTFCIIGNNLPKRQLNIQNFIDDPNSAFDGRKANKSGLQNRRGALRKVKIHDFRGHEFLAKFFRQPVFCSVCMEFCWYVLPFFTLLSIHIIIPINTVVDVVCK